MQQMTRQEAIDFINNQEPTFLKKARVEGYVCPHCASGTGPNGTGVKKIPNKKSYRCFACDTTGTVIDFMMAYKSLNSGEAIEECIKYYGITVTENPKREVKKTENNPAKTTEKQKTNNENIKQQNYIEYFKACNKNLDKTTYLKERGISQETADKFLIGYVEAWKHPKTPNEEASPRIIIPNSQYSYMARYTGEGDYIDSKGNKINRIKKVGTQSIFNLKAIWNQEQPVFIAEGEIDALSIIEVGGVAVGLGGTSGITKLIESIKASNNVVTQPIIISLDNDEAGQRASDTLKEELKKIKIYYTEKNVAGEFKDQNEALINNRENFKTAIEEAKKEAIKGMLKELSQEEEDYRNKYSIASKLNSFMEDIKSQENSLTTSTGFNNFDNALDGGLRKGLYIIGAISSIGKTTLALQLADQIAQSGTDVIYFSLEMEQSELISKSISRNTYMLAKRSNTSINKAKTNIGITEYSRYKAYDKEEIELIDASFFEYGKYADHIFIMEGIGDYGINEIKEDVNKHIAIMKKRPVVIIDYLQILAPNEPKATDKQNTDKAVLELKRLARDNKITVIAISSLNREAYRGKEVKAVSMEDFKESGAIEYGSDVLIGLQLKGQGEELKDKEDIENARKKNPVEVELKILKNRNGPRGKSAYFEYNYLFNNFTEI